MTKRQLVKWLEAKQSDAKAEVEIQYATAEKAYFAQRDEALKINETVDEVFRLISEADTVANRWKEALEKVGQSSPRKRAGRCGVVSRSYRPRYRLRPRDGVADERRQAPQPLPEWVRERAQSSQTGG